MTTARRSSKSRSRTFDCQGMRQASFWRQLMRHADRMPLPPQVTDLPELPGVLLKACMLLQARLGKEEFSLSGLTVQQLLDVSQATASKYLRQLTARGYLHLRSRESIDLARSYSVAEPLMRWFDTGEEEPLTNDHARGVAPLASTSRTNDHARGVDNPASRPATNDHVPDVVSCARGTLPTNAAPGDRDHDAEPTTAQLWFGQNGRLPRPWLPEIRGTAERWEMTVGLQALVEYLTRQEAQAHKRLTQQQRWQAFAYWWSIARHNYGQQAHRQASQEYDRLWKDRDGCDVRLLVRVVQITQCMED